MAQAHKPPMPCFARPNPTSASPVTFTHTLRHFSLKDGVPASFPYEPRRESNMTQIHYLEFRAHGPPPPDIGAPGDVWMDVRRDHHALYAHKNGTWERWPGPTKSKKHMFEHPLVSGRYLWCTKKAVLWYTCDGIRKSASLQTRGEEDDFGRERYRTVGPMERGAGRGAATDDAARVPLRTAEEAIAKILANEAEEERRAQEASRRRKTRDDDALAGSERPSARRRAETVHPPPVTAVIKEPEPSPLALTAIPLPRTGASLFAPPPPPPPQQSQPQPPPVFPSPSSLSQALGAHAVSPSHVLSPSLNVSPTLNGAHSSPALGSHAIPPSLNVSSPLNGNAVAASPALGGASALPLPPPPFRTLSSGQQTLFTQPAHGHASATSAASAHASAPAYPSPQSQPSPLEPQSQPQSQSQSSRERRKATEDADESRRLAQEAQRLAAENQRLSQENTRLAHENARLAQENVRLVKENTRLGVGASKSAGAGHGASAGHGAGHGAGGISLDALFAPGDLDALLVARVAKLQAEAQESAAARRDAEHKLAAMQDQLSRIQKMFQPGPSAALSTPGPSPRMGASAAEP